MTLPFKAFLTFLAAFALAGVLAFSVANAADDRPFDCGSAMSMTETIEEYITVCDPTGESCMTYPYVGTVPTEIGDGRKYCSSHKQSDGSTVERCIYTVESNDGVRTGGTIALDGQVLQAGRLDCFVLGA